MPAAVRVRRVCTCVRGRIWCPAGVVRASRRYSFMMLFLGSATLFMPLFVKFNTERRTRGVSVRNRVHTDGPWGYLQETAHTHTHTRWDLINVQADQPRPPILRYLSKPDSYVLNSWPQNSLSSPATQTKMSDWRLWWHVSYSDTFLSYRRLKVEFWFWSKWRVSSPSGWRVRKQRPSDGRRMVGELRLCREAETFVRFFSTFTVVQSKTQAGVSSLLDVTRHIEWLSRPDLSCSEYPQQGWTLVSRPGRVCVRRIWERSISQTCWHLWNDSHKFTTFIS